MILRPDILALTLSSLLTSLMTLYCVPLAVVILRKWDLTSGSERQLRLENSVCLISTIISCFLVFQLLSLFLFIYIADAIHNLFVGAMCALGTLSVNAFGYPALLLKIITCVLSGLWLIINYADSRGYDYPLIRVKCGLLLVMAPLILAETVLLITYFLKLTPDIITSCCGSLFSSASRTLATEIASVPPVPALAAYFVSALLTFAAGARFYRKGDYGALFGALSLSHCMVSMIAVISAVCLYIYAMPSHHCPFSMLQGEYHFIGYPIYLSMLTAVTTGAGAGWLNRYREIGSLRKMIPRMREKLTFVSLVSILFLAAVSAAYVFLTDFTMR